MRCQWVSTEMSHRQWSVCGYFTVGYHNRTVECLLFWMRDCNRKLNRKWRHDSLYKLLETIVTWLQLLQPADQTPNAQTSISCQLMGGLSLGPNLLWTAPLTPHVKGHSSFLSLTPLLPSSLLLCTFHLPSSSSSSVLIKCSPHFLLTHPISQLHILTDPFSSSSSSSSIDSSR